MSLIVAAALVASCSWANPGANPYQGQPVDAVAHYPQIPAKAKAEIAEKMRSLKYDDITVITRDEISGKHDKYSDLRLMHFGKNQVCVEVDRSSWKTEHKEVGLVYCSGDTCLIVPTVCRNVAMVTRIQQGPINHREDSGGGSGGGSVVVIPAAPQTFSDGSDPHGGSSGDVPENAPLVHYGQPEKPSFTGGQNYQNWGPGGWNTVVVGGWGHGGACVYCIPKLPFCDPVTSPVPEPSSAAMMSLVFLLAAPFLWRRRGGRG